MGEVKAVNIDFILNDEYLKLCLSIASQTTSEERYGAILVKNNKVFGIGRNRTTYYHVGDEKKKVNRRIPLSQGTSNHAEAEAMISALKKMNFSWSGKNNFSEIKKYLKGSKIYCAGYFPGKKGKIENPIFFRNVEEPDYTCRRCTRLMDLVGIESVVVPTLRGWVELPIDEHENGSTKYLNGSHHKRKSSMIDTISLKVVDLYSKREISDFL